MTCRPTWSFRVGFQCFAAVSRKSLNAHTNYLGAVYRHSLETVCLGLGFCFAAVSRNSFEQILNPAADSPGHEKHPERRKGSVLSFKSNTLTSALLPQVLLLCSFLEFSSTWWLPLQLNENGCEGTYKKMMLNRRRRLHHSSRLKLPSVNKSANSFLVSTYLIWILGVQVDSVKQKISRDSADSGHASHHRTSSFDHHLDHCLIVFRNVKLWRFVKWSTLWLPSFLNLTFEMRKQFPAPPLTLPSVCRILLGW